MRESIADTGVPGTYQLLNECLMEKLINTWI